MISPRFAASCCVSISLFTSCLIAHGQTTPAEIEQKLDAEYTVSKAAADKSDIVTAGSVLVLKKDGLIMSATTGTKAQDEYKDGKITAKGAVGAAVKVPSWMKGHVPGSDIKTRTFVAGEKFFVSGITVTKDGVVMELISDPFADVRYITDLKFPFKGSIPSVDQVDSTIAEVVKVQADDSAAAGKDAKQPAPAPASQAAAAAPAPMAAIPPPPPPPDTPPPAPKTIKLKQTREEVVAAFGEPTSIRDLGVKKIYIYPDMKVTFVNNKVTDIQ
jgi:hypothetical protein